MGVFFALTGIKGSSVDGLFFLALTGSSGSSVDDATKALCKAEYLSNRDRPATAKPIGIVHAQCLQTR